MVSTIKTSNVQVKDKITISQWSLDQWQDENLEHLRYEYNLKSSDIVLDIGSYKREFADEITKRYGCYVECFDALDNKAAWLYDGEVAMGGQFLYTSVYGDGSTKMYPCVDIVRYLNKEVALVKINIEGGEYQLLDYIIEEGLMSNIKNLQVQFHIIEGIDCESLYTAIAKKLSKTHELTWRYMFCWENWERRKKDIGNQS